MRSLLLCLAVLCTSLQPSEGSRVLLVIPFPGKSHHMFATAVMKALSAKGHHLVEFSPFPPKQPMSNHTHVMLQTTFSKELKNWRLQDLLDHEQQNKRLEVLGVKMKRILDMNYGVCEDTFKNKNIIKLLKSDEKFDLVITESTFGEESFLVFGHRFSAPTVALEPFFSHSVLNRYAGNDLSISYVNDLFSLLAKHEFLTFKERLENLFSISVTLLYHHFVHIPRHEEILKKFYTHSGFPPLNDMMTNVSLYLTNAHPTIVNYIRPITPNIVPIGGINIIPDRNPVTQELLSFIESAKEGLIYFSLGTVVPAHDFPAETLQIFVNAFKKLPQKVLWKVELDNIPGLSRNVKLVKFAPQITVLGHPNCRLFMTHGGLFSHQEALHAGVPTLALPFFADQPYNARFAEYRGVGVTLDFRNLNEQTLHEAISTVLSDNRYKENALRVSRIYRDRPVSPADSAVFWLEYVMRHNGAHHLRPAAATMPWYQLCLLDVLATLAAVAVAAAFLVWVVVRRIVRIVFGGRTVKSGDRAKKDR